MKNYWLERVRAKNDKTFYLSRMPRDIGNDTYEQIGIVEMESNGDVWVQYDWHGYGCWVSGDMLPKAHVGDLVYTKFVWGWFRPSVIEARFLTSTERALV